GRGPLAGPVTAAAVILNPKAIPDGLNDSKKLSEKRRESLFEQIQATSIVSYAHISESVIDDINILNASLLAMRTAVAGLSTAADFLLIDGNKAPAHLPMPYRTIIKGDAKSLSIAAASIIAKTVRDRLMSDLAASFPGYGWEKNAGYPSAEHKSALLRLGVTPHHRVSFKPIHNILYSKNK
ncbi:MAG: ribonuclease HII, partial [Paracoccaceae bacterium]|nr:ribonuclease HII [Paracoccaceae bacterium]